MSGFEYTKLLSELRRSDTSIAGGKAASLGELISRGYRVPGGFVIVAAAFNAFTEGSAAREISQRIAAVDYEDLDSIEAQSRALRELVLQLAIPSMIADKIEELFRWLAADSVAVRSSATAEDSTTAAWAGQLDTFLNVDAATLLTRVRECWASLYTPRALSYRKAKADAAAAIAVPVIVQEMVQGTVSGTAFSVHPVTRSARHVAIEAGYGLGEAVVSGTITPDLYVYDKQGGTIAEKLLNPQFQGLYCSSAGKTEWRKLAPELEGQQKLTDAQIATLAELAVRLERDFAAPCDVEWVLANGEIHLVQCRPVTTL